MSETTGARQACAFCGKGADQVRRLVAGPRDTAICDECVARCRELLAAAPPGGDRLERLWTPWRLVFIEQASAPAAEPACFLCAKPAEPPERDRANLVLYRGERAYVLLNLYPYNAGHLMVAPYCHVGDLPTLPAPEAADVWALTRQAVAVLTAAYRPQGFNVGLNLGTAAGAGVPGHLHVHVVPRWHGDTNFMPVVGHTKVLPETLEQTYDRLRPLFAPATPAPEA